MRNNRVSISALTKRELDAVRAAANFSTEQAEIFEELNRDDLYDFAIMTKLGIPEKKYYKLKGITVNKCEKVLIDLGYLHALSKKQNSMRS
jgi:hypothetical protein